MRLDRKRGGAKADRLVAVADMAELARVKGGLKAERVQGTDPTDPTGAGGG